VIDKQDVMTSAQFWTLSGSMWAICGFFIAFAFWIVKGKDVHRWWRRRKLNIPSEAEANMKTISGPTWEVKWIRTSEAKESRPDEQRTTVLGHTLAEVLATLRARYGDEFNESNIRGTEKRSLYGDVLVGIPDGRIGEEVK